MDRRTFIRLAGGGIVTAAAAGCSSDYPAVAIAPWRGPRPEAELRTWALSYAILAPNSHNRQPWLVDLREANAITLYVDRLRLLPETDPWFRQIIVSQGTFIELLVIALKQRGIEPQVTLFPAGEYAARALDDRPVARLQLTAGAPAPDPLFAQILTRHTAKVAYDTTRAIDAAHIAALGDVMPADSGHRLSFDATLEPRRVADLRRLCIDAARTEVSTPRTALESSRLMRIGPDEIARHRDGISVNGLMPRVALALGLFDPAQPPAPGSGAFEQVMKRFIEASDSAMGFAWITSNAPPGRTRSAEVQAGRAFVRQQLKATELGLQMHPMSQAPQEFPEMQAHHDRLREWLTGRSDAAPVVQMFSRIGYCAPQPHAPRRGVDAIIRA